MIFRFDDICKNTDMANANAIALYLYEQFQCEIQYTVSVLYNDNIQYLPEDPRRQYVFSPVFKAYSDHCKFYQVDGFCIPHVPSYVRVTSHGLFHIDHRLLNYDAQEMSIVGSCHLLKTREFVPPFNKWDENTIEICEKHDIHIQRFEDGWMSVEHEPYTIGQDLWYLHSRNITVEGIRAWLQHS